MIDREHGASYALTSVKLDRATLGPGTALVDDDVLRLLLLDSPTGEKALQIRYDAILGAAMGQGSVIISCRDGRSLVAATGEPGAFRGRLLAACRALPEVTRALRALGSRRGARRGRVASSDAEARFFAPLIEARRGSMEARDAESVIAAFDAVRLARVIEGVVREFAERLAGGHPARRRALEAELTDATEELSAALTALKATAALAAADVDDLGRWRAWAAAVQSVFEAADRTWQAIEPILER